MGWDSPSIGAQVKLFQGSSRIGISEKPVVLWLVSELGSLLGDLLDSKTLPSVGLQLIVDTPSGLKLRLPALMGYPLRSTIKVPPSVSCPKFPPLPSGMCLSYSLQATLVVIFSGAWTTLLWKSGSSWNGREAKVDNKVENKLEELVGLRIFIISTLPLSHVIGFLNGLATLHLWYLINLWKDYSFPFTNFALYVPLNFSNFSEALPPWGGSEIWAVWLGPLLNSCLDFKTSLPNLYIPLINL